LARQAAAEAGASLRVFCGLIKELFRALRGFSPDSLIMGRSRVSNFQQSPAEMNGSDFPGIIDGLLRRPLQHLHADQLRELKQKEKFSGLNEVDRIYILDIWNKFRSLPVDSQKPDQSAGGDIPADPKSNALAVELKRLNVTVEKLRAALKQVADHRDQLKAQVENLTKLALPAADGGEDRRFETTKKAFAKFYHPNTWAGHSRLDVSVRAEVFKEFWAELERIEADG
jgi:hypothetical protein